MLVGICWRCLQLLKSFVLRSWFEVLVAMDGVLATLIMFLMRRLLLAWVYPAFGSLFPIGVQLRFFTCKFLLGSLVHGAGNISSSASPVVRQVWTLKMAFVGLSSSWVSLGTTEAPKWVILGQIGASFMLGQDLCCYFAVYFCWFTRVIILVFIFLVLRAMLCFVSRFRPSPGVLVPAISGM